MDTNSTDKSYASSHDNPIDPDELRKDFPILQQKVNGKRLVYLDNAATTQKPYIVIDRIKTYYEMENANIHRGVHWLSGVATDAYEGAREKIRKFINAAHRKEIIFLRGATEGINLVKSSFGRRFIKPGDEVVISAMEHHSNIVPWQILCEESGAVLKVIPMDQDGVLDLDAYEKLLGPRTRIVAVTHVSNVLGTINPVERMIRMAHEKHIPVLIDGAQSAPHMPIDVQALDCDFYVLSGHKMYGPTGMGILYGKASILEDLPPYHGGGDMIRYVTFEKTTYNDLPNKFEAGTPNISGGIGLGAAVDYLTSIGMDRIAAHEQDLLRYANQRLRELDDIVIYGKAKEKAAVISFLMGDVHPHDIGTILDQEGIAIRTGHHCAQPIMDFYHIPATARATFALYNSREDVDVFIDALKKIKEVFA